MTEEVYECPTCGAEISADTKECPECGEQFVQVYECYSCGATVNENDSECPVCGEKFTEDAAEPAPEPEEVVAEETEIEEIDDFEDMFEEIDEESPAEGFDAPVVAAVVPDDSMDDMFADETSVTPEPEEDLEFPEAEDIDVPEFPEPEEDLEFPEAEEIDVPEFPEPELPEPELTEAEEGIPEAEIEELEVPEPEEVELEPEFPELDDDMEVSEAEIPDDDEIPGPEIPEAEDTPVVDASEFEALEAEESIPEAEIPDYDDEIPGPEFPEPDGLPESEFSKPDFSDVELPPQTVTETETFTTPEPELPGTVTMNEPGIPITPGLVTEEYSGEVENNNPIVPFYREKDVKSNRLIMYFGILSLVAGLLFTILGLVLYPSSQQNTGGIYSPGELAILPREFANDMSSLGSIFGISGILLGIFFILYSRAGVKKLNPVSQQGVSRYLVENGYLSNQQILEMWQFLNEIRNAPSIFKKKDIDVYLEYQGLEKPHTVSMWATLMRG